MMILLVAAATVENYFAGCLTSVSVFAFFTGLYVAVTGRKSWAMIPGGRKAGTLVAAVSIVLLVFGTLLIYMHGLDV